MNLKRKNIHIQKLKRKKINVLSVTETLYLVSKSFEFNLHCQLINYTILNLDTK